MIEKLNKQKELDQFYTNPLIAIKCFKIIESKIDLKDKYLIEPSAGTGSFSNLFKNDYLAIDIDSKLNYIHKLNFLNFDINSYKINKDIVTIGNPPFGKKSGLAIDFFNKASEFSKFICFILPKTFKKDSVINRLNRNMFLIYEHELEKNSFLFNNKNYDVPCVFQIWEKRFEERGLIYKKVLSNLFIFTNKENCDFAIRRIGRLSGKIFKEFSEYKESSHYYIKSLINKEILYNIINNSFKELNKLANNTVGNPSLSKGELIEVIENKF